MVAPSPAAAVDNAHNYGSYESGMCLKWVRGPCWELPSLYASAIDAWHGAEFKHPGDRNPPAGAPCFYEGGNYGHVVIACHGGMRSTDCTSAYDVSDAEIAWVENHWGYRYLGWTEDLNSVRVIPENEDEMALSDDDIERICRRVNKVLGDYDAEGAERDGYGGNGEPKPDYADHRIRQIENVVRDIKEIVSDIAARTGAD